MAAGTTRIRQSPNRLHYAIGVRSLVELVRPGALAITEEVGFTVPKSLPHQIAANSRWSREDPTAQGIRMRDGLEAKFLREVDPNNELPEVERRRRAESARRAYYQRLALASAKARKARSKSRSQGGGSNAA